MAQLSINVNKIATLRNARGQNTPSLEKVTEDLLKLGAKGITVHPRPDERHIRREDVFVLSNCIKQWNDSQSQDVEFNIEGYPSESFLNLIAEVAPDQCTLVPDGPDVITSNAGWDLVANQEFLSQVCTQLKEIGVRSSLFVDPHDFSEEQRAALELISPDRIELYTESYAKAFGTEKQEAITEIYRIAAVKAFESGVGINAGHDLDQKNLGFLIDKMPMIEEVSIGHALICEALYDGLEKTVNAYHHILKMRNL